jgi:Flp pilus assembly protein TadG
MLRNFAINFRRMLRHFGRFCAAERGATAVEFAIIVPAFIAALVALFQTCLFLFAQMAIQNAAVAAGRYFLTGQAQNSPATWTQTTIKNAVCPTALFNCNNMYLVVQDYSSFTAASTSPPAMYNSSGQAITSYAYDPGTQGDIMVVQLVYAWPVIAGPLGFTLSNLPNNAVELMGVFAFRVEPY